MTEARKGELFIAAETFLWSFFPVITVLSYSSLPPLVSLAWSSLFAGAFFGVLVWYKNLWHEMNNPQFWKYISGVTIFIGVLFYGLYYLGLQYTTPGNAAVVMLLQVATTYIFFQFFQREPFSKAHTAGAVLLSLGALIVLLKNFEGVNIGDAFILAATCAAPAGNFFQRKTREVASSETIMFVRSFAAAVIVSGLAFLLQTTAPFEAVRSSLAFLLINGFLILGLSKIFFLEAIHRIPVTKAIALESVSPILTLLIAWAVLSQVPNMWQLMSLVPMLLGVLLITDHLQLGIFGKRKPANTV